MKYKKIIVSQHYNRPNYTRRCISHLESCLGIEDYLVIFIIDPSKHIDEVHSIIHKCRLKKNIIVNEKICGQGGNCTQLLETAFEHGGEYVINVESDIILSVDALRMFEYCGEKFAKHNHIACVSAWNNRSDVPVEREFYKLGLRKYATFWGIAFWQHKLKNIDCTNLTDKKFGDTIKKLDKYVVYPLVSRSNHIGFNDGIHINLNGKNNLAEQAQANKYYPATLYWADVLLTQNTGEFRL